MTTISAAEPSRRDFILIATGAGQPSARQRRWPFIGQMNPDASTIAAGAPVEVDLGPIAGDR